MAIRDSYNSYMNALKNRINTAEAKNRFNQVLKQAHESKKPVIVEKRGEPVAVILDYQQYLDHFADASGPDQDRLSLIRDLKSWHQIMNKKYPKGTGDSARIIHGMRQQRYKYD